MSHHQCGYHYRFKKLEIWAEAGIVCIIDERFEPSDDRSFKTAMVGDFLLRLRSMSGELKKRVFKYADEREEYIKLIEDGVQVCTDAKKQGRPDDPFALMQMLRDRRRKMVLVEPANQHVNAGAIRLSEDGFGAIPSAEAPENAVLPPIPVAPADKPFTPLIGDD